MAETDEESEELAAETRRHSEDVERQGSELQAIFVERGWSKEKGLLDEFDRSWQDSRKLDAEILALAVRNTNLKAARLSQGRGIELLRRFMEELPGIGRKADGQDGSTLAGPACKAIQAAQMIQILHAPHIAEAESARMDQIEGEIRALDGEVRRGLEELKRGATSGEMKKVAAAGATYDEYAQVTREVVADSRQNTNVLSMALSMGQKRKVTARCMEILQSMRELVSKHEFKGTR
jgi:hypothetical protein